MIIDCHGHYTTAPKQLQAFRDDQIAELKAPPPARTRHPLQISDDELRASVQPQLNFQRDRGTDLTVFSPRASAMAHHIGDDVTSLHWAQHCNDLIYRVCELFPESFVGVCQLPQTPGVAPSQLDRRAEAVRERAGVHRLQPQPRSVGRPLDGAAADRSLLVSVLRGDGGAGRAGDGARERVVQPQLPRHRRPLPQRRHHRLHAVPDRAISSRTFRRCA